MVLRGYWSRIEVLRRRSSALLLNTLLIGVVSLPVAACRASQADQSAQTPGCKLREVQIDESQTNDVRTALGRLFQWRAYWTYNDERSRTSYNDKIGRTFPITMFSFRGGVIVHIPDLENSVVSFRRSVNGKLSNPDLFAGGLRVSFDGDKLMAIASLLTDWKAFLKLIGTETDNQKNEIPLPIFMSKNEMKEYIRRNRDAIKYCESRSEMTVLPLPPSYDAADDRKQALLEDIVRECIELAQTMFMKDKGRAIVINVPNFNVNDEEIWVLLEDEHGEAYTMRLDLGVTDKVASARYSNTVEIRSTPKYGIRIGADKKIKQASIKTLTYTIQ